MTRLLTFLAFSLLLVGCRPTYEGWSRDWNKVFQGYMTGDSHTAKAALLQEEKLATEHEARGNQGVDFVAVRTALYSQLCGISEYMGHTNDAQIYWNYLAVSPKNNKTYAELIEADKKADDLLKPKWREQK